MALPDGSDDQNYMEALEHGAALALQLARADMAIYIAGADPYHDDRLGRLSLTMDGLERRDRLVFELCRTAGLPVAVVMGGGYARRVEDTIEIHLQTIRVAAQYAAQ
jgi:acetoin utilization deacetylase AcuC-like enzyme